MSKDQDTDPPVDASASRPRAPNRSRRSFLELRPGTRSRHLRASASDHVQAPLEHPSRPSLPPPPRPLLLARYEPKLHHPLWSALRESPVISKKLPKYPNIPKIIGKSCRVPNGPSKEVGKLAPVLALALGPGRASLSRVVLSRIHRTGNSTPTTVEIICIMFLLIL